MNDFKSQINFKVRIPSSYCWFLEGTETVTWCVYTAGSGLHLPFRLSLHSNFTVAWSDNIKTFQN